LAANFGIHESLGKRAFGDVIIGWTKLAPQESSRRLDNSLSTSDQMLHSIQHDNLAFGDCRVDNNIQRRILVRLGNLAQLKLAARPLDIS